MNVNAKIALTLAGCILLGLACNAFAAVPVNPTNQTQTFSAFAMKARAPDTAATTTSGTTPTALGAKAPVARVCAVGAVFAYVALGSDNTVSVTAANGIPIAPNTCANLAAGGSTHIVAITASSTSTVQTMLGSGSP